MKARSKIASVVLLAGGVAAFLACGNDAPSGEAAPAPTTNTPPKPSASQTSTTPPVSSDAGGDAAATRVPRFAEVKGVLHVHSAYSHDACDDQGLDDAGVPNAACIADLRAAPCNVGLGFVHLTDHPAFMNVYEPKQNLLYDASKGDVLVMDDDGVSPIGNFVSCPKGGKVLFTFGYEGLHTLPIGLRRHPTRYEAYTTDRPLADVQALVADLKDAGALVALAHSEESDISAERIVEGGADLMEWYNPHGNFKKTLGTDKVSGNPLTLLQFFSGIEDFLAGSTSGAHPDLVYLRLLREWPTEGFTKWREVQRKRFVPGVLGSDVHQNISVDPVCTGAAQVLCTAAANGKYAALALLAAGGQLVMSDSKRLDTYDRIMRWLHNRVLTNDVTPAGLKEALGHGRSFGVYGVFGDPSGFYFEGQAQGTMLDLGDEAKGPVSLKVKVPDAPSPIQGGPVFDAAAAKTATVRAMLFRTDATGTSEIARSTSLGALIEKTVSEPGSYHVEVWIKPKHLNGLLGPQTSLSDAEYLWFITNPIRVAK